MRSCFCDNTEKKSTKKRRTYGLKKYTKIGRICNLANQMKTYNREQYFKYFYFYCRWICYRMFTKILSSINTTFVLFKTFSVSILHKHLTLSRRTCWVIQFEILVLLFSLMNWNSDELVDFFSVDCCPSILYTSFAFVLCTRYFIKKYVLP